jgi:hypothetical protein
VTFELLLDWADHCLEKSLNQPVLPHAIIVLNAVDVGQEEQRWEVKEATRNLLASAEAAFEREHGFIEKTVMWRKHGRRIDNVKDLLRCYYSSIQVVRIPMKSPTTYLMIDNQAAKVREAILAGCNKASYTKETARKLCSVDQLEEYLQAGFDHFARDLDSPFDFVKVSLRNKPIPQDLGDHIVTLAAAVQKRIGQAGQKLFQGLSTMVASCILLDIVRKDRKGGSLCCQSLLQY